MELRELPAKKFALFMDEVVETIKQDPIENFVKAPGLIDLTPSPAQEVILKVIFQKKLDSEAKKEVKIEGRDEKGNLVFENAYMTEVELYEHLTERVYEEDRIENNKITNINLICGRRSGKTLLSAIIAIYCAISNNWKPFLKKTPFATVLILSHSKEFSDEVLEVIKGLVEASPILSALINKRAKQTSSHLNLIVPFIKDGEITYSRVQLKVGAASSKTTRGVAACAVLCDEIAYWNLDENMKETDTKILKAVRPALKQFGEHGMLIKLSSPGIKQGVLYDERERYVKDELPDSYAVFKAPTWMMNPEIPLKELRDEWKLDPESFDVEYRANFADSLSNFMSPEKIDLSITRGIKYQSPSDDKNVKYFAAIDAAFKADRFTFTLVGVVENRVTQYVVMGWEGTRQDPVKAHTVAEYVKNVSKVFPLDYVGADQFAFHPLKEIFDQYGVELKEYTFTPMFKRKIYMNLKRLVNSEQLDLLDHAQQVKELKELVVEQTPTGTAKISHPAGGKDDYADVIATSCFLATEGQTTGKFEFEALDIIKTYGVKTDNQGRSIGAGPSPEMLVQSGHLPENVMDNSALYGIDPFDGKLKRKDKFEDVKDDDDGIYLDFG